MMSKRRSAAEAKKGSSGNAVLSPLRIHRGSVECACGGI
jgi:hypothetical protein